MKKALSVLLILIMSLSLFCGCEAGKKSDSFTVITTSYAGYDWLKNIMGDDENITVIGVGGTDMHSYQPTAADILAVSNADLLLYVGGESDSWVSDTVENLKKKPQIINMFDVLEGALREEENFGDEEDSDEVEYDEHVWLSLKNAVRICESVCDTLCDSDGENADKYKHNADNYTKKLKELDGRYTEATSGDKKPLVFADRFPFCYMANDYGLKYYAAFKGCSAETEASFEKVVSLADAVKEYKVENVIIIDGSDGKLAKTVIEASGKKCGTVTLYTMQSVTDEQLKSDRGYIEIMEENLETLKKVL